MVFFDAADAAITKALVRENMASSGQGAEGLFGDPVDYGRAAGWRNSPTRINAEAAERQDERRADARTLAGDDED